MHSSNQKPTDLNQQAMERRRFCKLMGVGVGAGLVGSVIGAGSTQAQELEVEMKIDQTLIGLQESAEKGTGHAAPNIQLGLAAYSFKEYFDFYKGKPRSATKWADEPLDGNDGKELTMFDFIDYCADHKCAAELTSYFFPADADDDYFRKIKRHAFLQGVPIVGTAIGNNFTSGRGEKHDQQIADAKKWIDNAAIMGAPHIRFFAGKRKEVEEQPENMAIAIEALQECCDYAAQKGVFIGVENHGDLSAEQVLKIYNGVKSDWFGINLDSGNFVSDDPYKEIAMCIPHAVNFQLKAKNKRVDKTKYESDIPRVLKIVKDSNYRGYVVVEFEEEQPYKHVPGLLKQVRDTFA